MKLEIASLTHIGKVRQNNEDALGYFEPSGKREKADKGTMFLVADGMGGHRGGEIASNLAVKTIISSYYASPLDEDPTKSLDDAFGKANKAILERSQGDATLLGMGTTCTAMVVREREAFFAHVGDSRAYVLRNGTLEQLTEDHSLVGEMVRSGIITDEDAQHHPKRNVITRSMGSHDDLPVDISSPYELAVGDVFLLCSDGLTSLVGDDEVKRILDSQVPEDAVNALVDLANDKGGKDNITVQIIKVSGED